MAVGIFLDSQLSNSRVWFAFPLAELVSLALSTFFLRRIFRIKLKDMESEENIIN